MLKIAHKREDIHRVHDAATSKDRRVRSNAGEFLDTLLSGRGQRDLRVLLRVVVDDLAPAERVARAAPMLGSVPAGRDEALAILIADRDEGLATLASALALSLGSDGLREHVDRARRDRSSLGTLDRASIVPVAGAAG